MRTQSANSAQVADARNPASAIAWRSESHQRGSNARRRARPQAAQPRANSAANAATAISPSERWLPAWREGVGVPPGRALSAGVPLGVLETVGLVPQQLGTGVAFEEVVVGVPVRDHAEVAGESAINAPASASARDRRGFRR
jgi:hypothetical protein